MVSEEPSEARLSRPAAQKVAGVRITAASSPVVSRSQPGSVWSHDSSLEAFFVHVEVIQHHGPRLSLSSE